MLILSRKAGESIVIDEDIVVTVLEVRNKQIRIGISAPQDVEVHREEVFLRICEERSQEEPTVLAPPVTGQRYLGQHNTARDLAEERP